MQAKLLLVFCVVIIALFVLVGRLVYINRTDGERYTKRVLSQQTYTSKVLPYQRGSIVDRNGTVLATSEKVYNLILDAKYLNRDEKYLKPTIAAVTECFPEITSDILMDFVTNRSDSQYIILHKGYSYDQMMLFKEKAASDSDIQGIWFEEEYVRKYPYNTLASDAIGFTSSGNVGNWGIEQFYNDRLNGTNGIEFGYIDQELKLERTIKPAINGNTIVSTIDANVQGIVQNHIKAFNEEFGSKNIGVLIMNPNNGEILAMASNEEYDLNNPTDLKPFYTEEEIAGMNEEDKLNALNTIWRNFVISDTYEPGSTFKPFTIAAGLEESIINQEDTFYCDGYELVGGWRIKCSKREGHGIISLTQALMYSCNDALMQIAAKEGKQLFYDYENFFGFGHKTGIDLPGEASGILVPEENIGVTDLATSSFGQTFNTTMIQLATGFSSLINGGYYYEPHMVKQILNADGGIVENIDRVLVKETVSAETSKFIKESMYLTVEDGTAKHAQVTGYAVGGKTGTAQKYPRVDKTYLVSFIGAVPADDPEIVIYVVIDEPQNVVKQADSSIATKFASKVLTDILPFLELYPSVDVEESINITIPVLPSTTVNGTENPNNNTNESEDTMGDSEDVNTGNESGNAGTETNASNNSNSNGENSENQTLDNINNNGNNIINNNEGNEGEISSDSNDNLNSNNQTTGFSVDDEYDPDFIPSEDEEEIETQSGDTGDTN